MSQPYIGEIRMVGFNFAPVGWQLCDGTLLPINENSALFNLIGTTYGGDGQSTFAVPDLRGRVPIHFGTGPGNSFQIGQMGGATQVTLTTPQIPSHTHTAQGAAGGLGASPVGQTWGDQGQTGTNVYAGTGGTEVEMSAQALATVGGNQSHANQSPYLAVNFAISLFGIFPSQT